MLLTLEDYYRAADPAWWDSLALADATLLERTEAQAVAEVASYLAARYDVAALLGPPPPAEVHPLLRLYLPDLVLHHLAARLTPQGIPPVWQARYGVAVAWLQAVAAGAVVPGFPPRPPEGAQPPAPFYTGSCAPGRRCAAVPTCSAGARPCARPKTLTAPTAARCWIFMPTCCWTPTWPARSPPAACAWWAPHLRW